MPEDFKETKSVQHMPVGGFFVRFGPAKIFKVEFVRLRGRVAFTPCLQQHFGKKRAAPETSLVGEKLRESLNQICAFNGGGLSFESARVIEFEPVEKQETTAETLDAFPTAPGKRPHYSESWSKHPQDAIRLATIGKFQYNSFGGTAAHFFILLVIMVFNSHFGAIIAQNNIILKFFVLILELIK
jgi:hypothetical protein